MRKLRFWTLLTVVFLRRFAPLLVTGIIAGILIFIVLPRVPVIEERLMPTERVGLVGRFTQEELPLFIQQEISLGLTTLDSDGSAKAGLANSWEGKEEGKVWVFKLDLSRRWQDGKPTTAADINYKFADVVVTRPDEKTLEFKLSDPYSAFPVLVSKPVFKRGLLGAGNYRAAKITSSGQFIREILLVKQSGGERKLYRFYPTEEAASTAFKIGEVDKLLGIFDPRDLLTWENVKFEKKESPDRYVAIFFDTTDKLVSEKNLRQALSYAIDKGKLAGSRAISPLSPTSWAYNPLVKPYNYSQTRAAELIDDLPKEQKESLQVKLVTIPTLLEKAEVIASLWEVVGVKTQVQVSNTPPAEFQALLATQAIPPDPDQYSLWHSTQTATNITSYRDPRIDKLLEDGRKELNQEERKQIYFDFQRFLVEDSPAIFLYHPETYTITRK